MKILIYSQHFWPESFKINRFAELLKDNGHLVEVVTGKPNYPSGIFFENYNFFSKHIDFFNNIKIYRFPLLPRGKSSSIRLSLNYLSFFISSIILIPFIFFNKKYDYILVFGSSPIIQSIPAKFISLFTKSKVILWVQDLWPDSVLNTGHIKNKFLLNLINFLSVCSYKCSDLLLSQSKSMKIRLSEFKDKNKIFYLPNFVENEFFDNTLDSYKAIKKNSNFNITFAGNIGHAQSIPTLINAAKILSNTCPNVIFHIYGNGSMFNYLQESKKKYSLNNIRLKGVIDYFDIKKYLIQSDALLILLSKESNFNLTIPSKIQTYLSIGVPIVGSLNGEGANVLNKSCSSIVSDACDHLALAKNIEALSKMRIKDRQIMGMNAKKYCEKNYTQNIVYNKFMKILKIYTKSNKIK